MNTWAYLLICSWVGIWGVTNIFQSIDNNKLLKEVIQNQRQIVMLLAPEYKNAVYVVDIPADKNPKRGMKHKNW